MVGPKEAHPPSKPRQRQLVLKRRLGGGGGVHPAPFFRKVFYVRQAGGSPSLPLLFSVIAVAYLALPRKIRKDAWRQLEAAPST